MNLQDTTATNEAPTEASDALPDTAIAGGDTAVVERAPADSEAPTTEAEAPAEAEVLAPETYELTASEGKDLDASLIEAATPVLKELNLTNEQAQTLIPLAEQAVERATAAAMEQAQAGNLETLKAQAAEWLKEAKADEKYGGANWNASLAAAAKARDALGLGDDFNEIMNATGLGNHPGLIKAFAELGRFVGEDSKFVVGTPGAAPAKTSGDIAAQMYPNDAPK